MHPPAIDMPSDLADCIALVTTRLAPLEIWLFGSRARGEAGPNSDWDFLAVVPDDSPARHTDPVTAWEIAQCAPVPVTLLVTRQSDLAAIWGLPNTIGYDLAHEGVRLRVN